MVLANWWNLSVLTFVISDVYELGWYTPSGGDRWYDGGHDNRDGLKMDQVLQLGKEESEKQKSIDDQGKGINRVFVLPIKTP